MKDTASRRKSNGKSDWKNELDDWKFELDFTSIGNDNVKVSVSVCQDPLSQLGSLVTGKLKAVLGSCVLMCFRSLMP